jgi:short-subunit dehydrogenase
VERAAAAVERQWGRIDTWVNCAMATVFAPVADTTPEEYRRVTEVTYLGYVYGTQAALRRMRPRDQGTIIQIGSALAYRSIPLQSAYCAAKAAIRGFTDSLRTELIHERSHVRLSMLQLPAVNTPQSLRQRNKLDRQQQPVPPLYSPESIAELVVWAAEHAPREMLIGRPTLQAVLAQKLVPGLLDWYLGRNGYEAQLIDRPNDQPGDILFDTLPGDPGAHGPYRDRERGPDLQMRLRRHPRAVAVAALAAVGLGATALLQRR